MEFERGGHPVLRKKMTTEYVFLLCERLLQGLDTIDWTESLRKSTQLDWKSVGATVTFQIQNSRQPRGSTTRPDTIFGVSFMTLAPEHDLVAQITTPEQKAAVEAYVEATAKRSERERMADVKTISGVFTGAYAVHPFTHQPIPIWIGDYVLAGYGTGAVMAVPAGDERDYAFAKHFGIEIKNIFDKDISEALQKKAVSCNSDFKWNGLQNRASKIIEELEKIGAGKARLIPPRDAVFRDSVVGEPFRYIT